jgi:hypothetical protein
MYNRFKSVLLLIVQFTDIDYVVNRLVFFITGEPWFLYYFKTMQVGIYFAMTCYHGDKVCGWANFQCHSVFYVRAERFCCRSFRGRVPLVLPLLDVEFF